jgi:hypothetical protein
MTTHDEDGIRSEGDIDFSGSSVAPELTLDGSERDECDSDFSDSSSDCSYNDVENGGLRVCAVHENFNKEVGVIKNLSVSMNTAGQCIVHLAMEFYMMPVQG